MAHQAIPLHQRDAFSSGFGQPAASAFHEIVPAPAARAIGFQVPPVVRSADDLDDAAQKIVAAIKKA